MSTGQRLLSATVCTAWLKVPYLSLTVLHSVQRITGVDLLNWDTNDIFYFRAKVDLAALAFRDYDPDDKKRNLVRYMQLNILWQWPLRNEQDDDELRGPRADRRGQYALFKYRFRMGNHKLRMLAVPSGPSTRLDMRWTWRPTEHLHFTFVTHVRSN